MDLNHLYSQHQIALMKAGAAESLTDRRQYLHSASDIARQIGSYQLAQGARASVTWCKAHLHSLWPVAVASAGGTTL